MSFNGIWNKIIIDIFKHCKLTKKDKMVDEQVISAPIEAVLLGKFTIFTLSTLHQSNLHTCTLLGKLKIVVLSPLWQSWCVTVHKIIQNFYAVSLAPITTALLGTVKLIFCIISSTQSKTALLGELKIFELSALKALA